MIIYLPPSSHPVLVEWFKSKWSSFIRPLGNKMVTLFILFTHPNTKLPAVFAGCSATLHVCVCVCLHIELTPGSRWRGICHPRRQHPEWYPFLSILLEFKLPFTPQVAQYWYFDLMTKWIINNLFPVCKCFDDHHYLSFNTPSVERQWTRVRRTTVQTIRAFYHPHIKKYITDLCHRHHLKHPEWTFIYVYLIILYLHAMTHCGWSGRWWMMDGWMLFCKLRLHVLSLSVQTDSSCHCHTTTTTIQLSGSE